jgi:hypothetical protein
VAFQNQAVSPLFQKGLVKWSQKKRGGRGEHWARAQLCRHFTARKSTLQVSLPFHSAALSLPQHTSLHDSEFPGNNRTMEESVPDMLRFKTNDNVSFAYADTGAVDPEHLEKQPLILVRLFFLLFIGNHLPVILLEYTLREAGSMRPCRLESKIAIRWIV